MSSLFQDGHTLGKKAWSGNMSASYYLTPEYARDTANQTVQIDAYHIPVPWLQLAGQYGLTDRVDVGASFGLGIFTVGLSGFGKWALLPNKSPWGLALYGEAGFAALNDDLSIDGEEQYFFHFVGALPLSYDFNEHQTFVVQPIVSREAYRYNQFADQIDYKGRLKTEVYKLGLSYVKSNLNDNRIHYNITINYSPQFAIVFPTVGIGIDFH